MGSLRHWALDLSQFVVYNIQHSPIFSQGIGQSLSKSKNQQDYVDIPNGAKKSPGNSRTNARRENRALEAAGVLTG